MKKLVGIILLYILAAVLLLPFLVTALWGGFHREQPKEAKALYHLADLAPLETELEEYVAGVVAAEMPAAFPEEALKAQAVAARTYQVRQMRAAGSEKVLYDVGQAYCSREEQKEKWGESYGLYASKIKKAVQATAGEIMVYEGEPILAAFHAQSGGKTEAAENVWSRSVPYLKSVDSHEDLAAPGNEEQVFFSGEELWSRLRAAGQPKEGAEELTVMVISRTAAGYVDEVQAGGLNLSGRELRELLGLRSANFTVERQGKGFLFTTHGYGHGAGMSQYGASFLAEKGMTYHQILKHYYTGVNFQSIA